MIKQKVALPEELRCCIYPDEKLRFVLHNKVGPAVQPIWILAEEHKKEFTKEVKEMLNVFESMECEVDEMKKGTENEILQKKIDRLLVASLTGEIRNCVLSSVEKLKIKMKKLDDENMLLSFQVESLIKEQENVKLEYQKLFNPIKTTRAQHQKELNELIENVNQKIYAYADVRAQNQDLLITISELKIMHQTRFNVDDALHVGVPKISIDDTNGYLKDNLPRIISLNLTTRVPKIIEELFKPHASYYKDQDDHPNDNHEGEKNSKKQKSTLVLPYDDPWTANYDINDGVFISKEADTKVMAEI
ncbi:hypothetical protein Tco_0529856 [Tanacetum coccineum]